MDDARFGSVLRTVSAIACVVFGVLFVVNNSEMRWLYFAVLAFFLNRLSWQ